MGFVGVLRVQHVVLPQQLRPCSVLTCFHVEAAELSWYIREGSLNYRDCFLLAVSCYKLLDVLSNLCSFSLLLVSEVKPEGRLQAKCSRAEGNGCFAMCSSRGTILVFQVYHPAQLNLQTIPVSSSHVGSLHMCV